MNNQCTEMMAILLGHICYKTLFTSPYQVNGEGVDQIGLIDGRLAKKCHAPL